MSDVKTHVGIKPCGCKTAAMMNDGFTPDEIREFIESCEQRGMRVELHDVLLGWTCTSSFPKQFESQIGKCDPVDGYEP